MEKLWGFADLIRQGFFESEMAARYALKKRRIPPPMKIGGKLKWKVSTLQQWFERGSIVWIPRSSKK